MTKLTDRINTIIKVVCGASILKGLCTGVATFRDSGEQVLLEYITADGHTLERWFSVDRIV